MKANQAPQKDSALNELFVNELKDILWAEKHLVKNLPNVADSATSAQLKDAIEKHLQETENHVERLNRVFASIGESPDTKKCDAMNGLVKETEEMIDETEEGTLVRDVAIISCAQKVEHYEIATYGTLKVLASNLGYTEAEKLLEETLQEEKNADATLTEIAEGFVNQRAEGERRS